MHRFLFFSVWFSSNMEIKYPLYRYKNVNFVASFTTAEYLDLLQSYEIRDSDTFLVTYPKSGQWNNSWKSFFFNFTLFCCGCDEPLQAWCFLTETRVTPPPTGTIWTQQIITSIGQLDGDLHEYPKTVMKLPFLEYTRDGSDHSKRPSPRFYTSHLIPALMPPGVTDKKAKVSMLWKFGPDRQIKIYRY